MRIKLASILFLWALLSAGTARADSFTFSIDNITVTSTYYYTNQGVPDSGMTFDFPDGSGFIQGLTGNLGNQGGFSFTIPVSNVTFVWDGLIFEASDNLGDTFTQNPFIQFNGGDVTWTGPGITSITWAASDFGEISAMTYTTPEPGTRSLLLLGAPLPLLLAFQKAFHFSRQSKPS